MPSSKLKARVTLGRKSVNSCTACMVSGNKRGLRASAERTGHLNSVKLETTSRLKSEGRLYESTSAHSSGLSWHRCRPVGEGCASCRYHSLELPWVTLNVLEVLV